MPKLLCPLLHFGSFFYIGDLHKGKLVYRKCHSPWKIRFNSFCIVKGITLEDGKSPR